MPSKILYDARDNQIKRCQPEPHGSASLPSKKALCRSARIPENEKEYMETCIIQDDILTTEAKNNYRIVENKAIMKPKIKISTNKEEIDISKEETFIISVEILDTFEDETFKEVDILIEDSEITIELEDNEGNQEVELSEEEVYIITSNDDRFRSNSIKVEGV